MTATGTTTTTTTTLACSVMAVLVIAHVYMVLYQATNNDLAVSDAVPVVPTTNDTAIDPVRDHYHARHSQRLDPVLATELLKRLPAYVSLGLIPAPYSLPPSLLYNLLTVFRTDTTPWAGHVHRATMAAVDDLLFIVGMRRTLESHRPPTWKQDVRHVVAPTILLLGVVHGYLDQTPMMMVLFALKYLFHVLVIWGTGWDTLILLERAVRDGQLHNDETAVMLLTYGLLSSVVVASGVCLWATWNVSGCIGHVVLQWLLA